MGIHVVAEHGARRIATKEWGRKYPKRAFQQAVGRVNFY